MNLRNFFKNISNSFLIIVILFSLYLISCFHSKDIGGTSADNLMTCLIHQSETNFGFPLVFFKKNLFEELVTNFPWLSKYENDKSLVECGFNAHVNGNLIKKELINQYLHKTQVAFNEFQEYILKTYPNLMFTYCYTDYFSDSYQTQIETITFGQDYFDWINDEINWDKFFDKNKLTFIPQTSHFLYLCSSECNSERQVKAYFLNDKINGIYHIDNKDKNNKNNEINQKVKTKIEEMKKDMDYIKKQLLIFANSLSQPKLSNNEETEELITFLCQIATINRKNLDYKAIAKNKYDQELSELLTTNEYRREFLEWIQDYYNVVKYIPKENLPFIANNRFGDFFNYLYCEREKYVNNETIDFKKVVSDFLPIAKSNYKIIALEKAVASYVFATLKNKVVFCNSFCWYKPTTWTFVDWEEFIFENWNEFVWIFPIIATVIGFSFGALLSSTTITTLFAGGSANNPFITWFGNLGSNITDFFSAELMANKSILGLGGGVILASAATGGAIYYVKNSENSKILDDIKTSFAHQCSQGSSTINKYENIEEINEYISIVNNKIDAEITSSLINNNKINNCAIDIDDELILEIRSNLIAYTICNDRNDNDSEKNDDNIPKKCYFSHNSHDRKNSIKTNNEDNKLNNLNQIVQNNNIIKNNNDAYTHGVINQPRKTLNKFENKTFNKSEKKSIKNSIESKTNKKDEDGGENIHYIPLRTAISELNEDKKELETSWIKNIFNIIKSKFQKFKK